MEQSALDPAAPEAARIATLFWWMTAGAAIVWAAVVALTLYASYFSRRPHDLGGSRRLIVLGGAVFPTVVLAGLLSVGLWSLPSYLAPAPAGSLRVLVTGEQYWWRVRYLPPGGPAVELANELHLPLGEPTEVLLESRDVIHSFWIPALAGKMDMIPGRQNRLVLRPNRAGVFRGVCAEYCGTSHAFMAFSVVVEPRAALDRWLQHQASPARKVTGPANGRELFLASGCGACHTIRGTEADGVVGPDLTHVGGRRTLAAGRLPNTAPQFRRWLAHTSAVKPNVLMPAFGMLPDVELVALAAYLEGLE